MLDSDFVPKMSSDHFPVISVMLQMRTVAELSTIRNLLAEMSVQGTLGIQDPQSYPHQLESKIEFVQKMMNDEYQKLYFDFYKKFGQ